MFGPAAKRIEEALNIAKQELINTVIEEVPRSIAANFKAVVSSSAECCIESLAKLVVKCVEPVASNVNELGKRLGKLGNKVTSAAHTAAWETLRRTTGRGGGPCGYRSRG